MELLATVHWVMTTDPAAADDWRRAVEIVHKWTPRKRRMYTEDHIRIAWQALRDRVPAINAPTTDAGATDGPDHSSH